jgi:hypothetical protein
VRGGVVTSVVAAGDPSPAGESVEVTGAAGPLDVRSGDESGVDGTTRLVVESADVAATEAIQL